MAALAALSAERELLASLVRAREHALLGHRLALSPTELAAAAHGAVRAQLLTASAAAAAGATPPASPRHSVPPEMLTSRPKPWNAERAAGHQPLAASPPTSSSSYRVARLQQGAGGSGYRPREHCFTESGRVGDAPALSPYAERNLLILSTG